MTITLKEYMATHSDVTGLVLARSRGLSSLCSYALAHPLTRMLYLLHLHSHDGFYVPRVLFHIRLLVVIPLNQILANISLDSDFAFGIQGDPISCCSLQSSGMVLSYWLFPFLVLRT